MLQIGLAMAVPEIIISNDGLIRIRLLSEIKMFHGIFTITMLSMSNQVPITTSNSFLLSHQVAMGGFHRYPIFYQEVF